MRLIDNIMKMPRWLAKNCYLLLNRKRFKYVGKKVRVYKPLLVEGAKNIVLEDNVVVHNGTWLAALPLTGTEVIMILKEGATIGNYNHIYATQSIVIEKNVLTADKVYISDNLHCYENIDLPVIQQPIRQCNPVVIGEGSWLGEHVCVIGASIGKHCVIGANSVVTKDIPDYSVAVGSPAKVIKQYDFNTCRWLRLT